MNKTNIKYTLCDSDKLYKFGLNKHKINKSINTNNVSDSSHWDTVKDLLKELHPRCPMQ